MKKLFPVLMVVALTAGCGSGVINADCDSSYESFCDENTLYQIDFCGNTTILGQCEHGCNLEFTSCQGACSAAGSPEPAEMAVTFTRVEDGRQTIPAGLYDLPQIEPGDR